MSRAPHSAPTTRLGLPMGLGAAILIVTLVLWQALLAHERTLLQHNVAAELVQARDDIAERMEPRIRSLRRMANRWAIRGGVPRREWESDARQYVTDLQGFQALERVDPTLHVQWVIPLQGNEAARGLPLAFEPVRRAALKAARRSHQVAITHTIQLVQGGRGFLACVPIFEGERFDGFIVGVFRVAPLLRLMARDVSSAGYRLAVYDGAEHIYGSVPTDTDHWQETELNIHGTRWPLRVWAGPQAIAEASSVLPTVVLLMGIGTALLVAMAAYLALTASQRAAALQVANRELEHQIGERVAAEAAMLEATQLADAASQAKSLFLANMSHEIRTPMNGIVGMIEVTLGSALTEQQRRYLNIAFDSAHSLMSLLNDLLDISRIEAGKMRLERVAFDVRETLRAALALFAWDAEVKGLSLTSTVRPEVPERASGDPGRLRQVVVNLVGNAIKYTDQGSVRVEVGMLEDPPSPELWIHVRVADTGRGIAEHEQAAIFDAFTRAQDPSARRTGGAGLGLAISSQLVSLMGGRMWVESVPGQGSVFHFTVALGSVEAVPLPPTAPAAAAGRALRVLLAEDSPVNQLWAMRVLESAGHSVQVALDGRDVLEAVDAATFDVILMDIRMPDMDGIEAARAVRARGCRTPIVALSAQARADDREWCKRAGMDDYLARPVTQEQLLETVCGCAQAALASGHLPAVRPPFDREALLTSVSHDRDLLGEMAQLFTTQSRELLDELRQALQQADAIALERGAHTLSSCATTVAALPLADVSRRVELAAGRGALDEARTLMPRLEEELSRLHHELAAFSPEQTGRAG